MRFTMVLLGLGVILVVGLLGRELGGDTVGWSRRASQRSISTSGSTTA